ncbi:MULTISPECIES: DUF1190 domain-containing protein [Halomonas]|uniref:DUF1190 domain-containing protein n=1 Tax=Halomonas halophila TaxID=29573 RepID=A0ABQ0U0F5_9GAMM|nr:MULTISPECIES: DUF1190 domain-containing protein [Halomonas]MDR5888622.1 DUF1190 domain-containing protein [Halomonas salina]WJY07803.1 DUF1190 domain-containing protein [Halomonas halophila]GEK72016.1 hypothetical protein HHA04nite_05600 [Halomonas halophila]
MDNANKHLPRRKRSMRITLALMGAGAATALSGCGDSTPPETLSNVEFDDTETYRSVEECVEGGIYTQQACQSAYEEAQWDLPRYHSEGMCEVFHGDDGCQPAPQTHSGSSSSFVPVMMGYMVGNMTASSSRGHMVNRPYQEPIYTRADGNQGDWSAASSRASSRMRNTKVSMRNSVQSQNRASRSYRSTSRSGFGSRSSARGGFGS